MKHRAGRIVIVIAVIGICLGSYDRTGCGEEDAVNVTVKPRKQTVQVLHDETSYDLSEKRKLSLSDIKTFLGIKKAVEDDKKGKFSVAIIDTGVFPHKALNSTRNKIVAFKDFVYGKEKPYDDSGHGTAIAGIITADAYEGKEECEGIAPLVDIVAVKALNHTNTGSIDHIIEAMEWTINNKEKYNIKIINISIGVNVDNDKNVKRLEQICKQAYEAGILVVTSVGNIHGETKQYAPAIFEHVVSVGSIEYDNQGDSVSIAEYSQQWKKENGVVAPSVYALGTNIVTLKTNRLYKGNLEEKIYDRDGYEIVSGTSFATAVITGVACRLMQEYPDKSIKEIEMSLLDNEKTIYNDKIGREIPIVKWKG